ncbi:unnamed protein product [Paramecium pentaurelia]|uniref:Kelch motif family protein n=1 Tax=Paramecium pentaurelia TaxID=43138 RepID=A0A8S1WV36_9CILI|nr:unnamed protein product [Paramecium pentaurelia]
MINSQSSGIKNTLGGSKRYVSPYERFQNQESDGRKLQQQIGNQVKSRMVNIDNSEQVSVLGDNNNPNKLSNLSQFAQFMYIPCQSHPEFFITTLCQEQNCVEPLCAECITNHLEQHQKKGKQPKFENILRVRKDQICKIDDLLKQLQIKLKEAKTYFNETPQMIYNNAQEQVKLIHGQISDMINDYFQGLQRELNEYNQDEQMKQMNLVEEEIIQQQNELLKLQEDLQNDNYIKAITQIFINKEQIYSEKNIYKLDKMVKDFNQNKVEVILDKSNLELLQTYCKKLCYLLKSKKQTSISNIKQSSSIQQQQFQFQQFKQPQEVDQKGNLSSLVLSKLVSSDIPPIINPISLISENLTNETAICKFNYKNHFEDGKDQVIIRLEEGGFAAYIYDIQSQKYRIETINSTIRIPLCHKLYTTSFGKHLVIGGVDKEKSRFKAIAHVYEFNHNTLQLTLHSEMILARSMTSACQVDNFLYVVGGSSTNDENTSIAKAEKLDLTTRKWYSIEDPFYKTTGCALVSIDYNTLIKIGGKCDIFTPCNQIESYDIQKNLWTIIEFKFISSGYLRLPFQSCAVTISKDQILIIGGSIHDVRADETQIFNVEQKTIQRSSQLPNSIDFPTQTAIIQYNSIYILTENEQPLLYGNQDGFKYQ